MGGGGFRKRIDGMAGTQGGLKSVLGTKGRKGRGRRRKRQPSSEALALRRHRFHCGGKGFPKPATGGGISGVPALQIVYIFVMG